MGAIAALKGYRVQFLYSLYRILLDENNGKTYLLEGNYEDLDILDDCDAYIECIQVKNIKGTLQFSGLFSAQDSFFKRALDVIRNNSKVKVQVISFGPVSDELMTTSALKKKLQSKKFSDDDIQLIIDHYCQPQIVDEQSLLIKTIEAIKERHQFIDTNVCVELLLSWMYSSAEHQIPISQTNITFAINRIGKFIQECADFHSEYGHTIIPLQTKSIDNENINLLQEGYYYGVSAKYEHILANVDVIREKKLQEIDKAFKSSNIVFIHGASGQGKSSLAYRYQHDYLCDITTYELKLSNNYNDVRTTINCLDGLCKGLKISVVVYVDVLPGYNYWSEVIKEFSTKYNLKFLITLRQETWNSTVLSEEYSYKDIELSFDKEEANIIYESLTTYKADLEYVNFEESWLQFGEAGLLLEYIYFINHGDKLKIRLKNQVHKLEAEQKTKELEILRYVCLADAYSSKINYIKLLNALGVDNSLAQSFVRLLEKEYLLRYSEDTRYLTGLHPIRSKLLCEILFDENEYINKYEYITRSIDIVDEFDLHNFLLNGFYEGYDILALFKHIKERTPQLSWVGIGSIVKALLWKGVYDFIFEYNTSQFNALYEKLKSGWYLGLPYDFSETFGGSIYDSLRDVFVEHNPEILSFLEQLAVGFGPKNDVYKHLKTWFSLHHNYPVVLTCEEDLSSLGLCCFWLGYLKIGNAQVKINENSLIKLSTEASVNTLADLSLGLWYCNYSTDVITQIRNIAVKSLRAEFYIVYLEVGSELDSLYIYDTSNMHEHENGLNDRSMTILEVLRKLYPESNRYSTRCVGMKCFNTALIADDFFDPSVKHIDRQHLPLAYLSNINKLVINLYDYSKRPNSWEDHVQIALSLRKGYCELMDSLINGFIKYFKDKNVKGFITVCEQSFDILQQDLMIALPKTISDKWGVEGDVVCEAKPNNESKSNKLTLIYSEYIKYKNSQRDYQSALHNFFNQLSEAILNIMKVRNGESVESNANLPYVHLKDAILAHFHYMREIDNKFTKYYSVSEVKSLGEKERSNLFVILNCWRAFSNNRDLTLKLQKVTQEEVSRIKKDFETRIIKTAKATKLYYSLNIDAKIVDRKLVFTCDVTPSEYEKSLIVVVAILRECLKSDYFSVKRERKLKCVK